MVIVETAIFTKQIQAILSDDEYRLLQNWLVANPWLGKIIIGSGGLRKLRWSSAGRGKRSGIRIIYYWFAAGEVIVMLFAYPKNVQDDLTRAQLRTLKQAIDEEYR